MTVISTPEAPPSGVATNGFEFAPCITMLEITGQSALTPTRSSNSGTSARTITGESGAKLEARLPAQSAAIVLELRLIILRAVAHRDALTFHYVVGNQQGAVIVNAD
ncbi:MAG: hypothetical protein ABI137_05805 [Antricoccus sp.]